MGILGKLLKTTIHLATTPLDLLKDAVTLGGEMIDEDPAIIKKANKLKKDLSEIEDSINEL